MRLGRVLDIDDREAGLVGDHPQPRDVHVRPGDLLFDIDVAYLQETADRQVGNQLDIGAAADFTPGMTLWAGSEAGATSAKRNRVRRFMLPPKSVR